MGALVSSLKSWVLKLGLSPRSFVIALPYVWLLFFFLLPFLIVLKISFAEWANASPPYTPLIEWTEGIYLKLSLSFENYQLLWQDNLYLESYLTSLKIATISTLLTLLVGYPLAYAMSQAPKHWQPVLLMLIILPFWTSFLIRVYAWIGILKKDGFINMGLEGIVSILRSVGLDVEFSPLTIFNTPTAVYIVIIYSYLPFMVLPLYANLQKMDGSLREAAADLGCHPLAIFWKITLPLSLPGIVAGCFLVFIPAVGEFVIPYLMGGNDTNMIGRTLWLEYFSNGDWPVASAVAVILLLLLIVPITIFQKTQERR